MLDEDAVGRQCSLSARKDRNMGGGIGECFRVMFIFNGYLLHHPARACMWLSLLTLWYSCQANRVSIAPPPRPADTPPHRPAENELVEVAVKGEDRIVDARCEGNVTKIKGGFVYVAFSAVSGPAVVELDRLRAAQNHAPARLEKRNFEVAEHLQACHLRHQQATGQNRRSVEAPRRGARRQGSHRHRHHW